MTNAEIAQWFANQPPNEEGKIFILNGDASYIDYGTLNLTNDSDIEEFEDDVYAEDAINHLHIFLKS